MKGDRYPLKEEEGDKQQDDTASLYVEYF